MFGGSRQAPSEPLLRYGERKIGSEVMIRTSRICSSRSRTVTLWPTLARAIAHARPVSPGVSTDSIDGQAYGRKHITAANYDEVNWEGGLLGGLHDGTVSKNDMLYVECGLTGLDIVNRRCREGGDGEDDWAMASGGTGRRLKRHIRIVESFCGSLYGGRLQLAMGRRRCACIRSLIRTPATPSSPASTITTACYRQDEPQ